MSARTRLVLALLVGGTVMGALAWMAVGLFDGERDDGGGGLAAVTPTLADQLAEVALAMESIRELDVDGIPASRFLTPDEFRALISEELSEYTVERADLDRRFLAALGAVPHDIDLHAIVIAAYEEQVVGLYDPEVLELYVATDDPTSPVGVIDEVTLAHELAHALVDQVIHLPDLAAFGDDEGDALLAVQALVEGDASLAMQQYALQELSALDQLVMAGEALGQLGQLQALEAMPPFLRRSLEFPYVEGLAFVRAMFDRGGWEAVDAMYGLLPTSTAQIMDVNRYLRGEDPIDVDAPAGPGEGWDHAAVHDFGAFDLSALLDAPGGDTSQGFAFDEVVELSLDWLGGRGDLWTRGDESVVVVTVAIADADLCPVLPDWYARSFPSSVVDDSYGDVRFTSSQQSAALTCDEHGFTLAVAPSADVAAGLLGR